MKVKRHIVFAVLSPIALGILAGLAVFLAKVPALSLPRLEFLLNTIISCSATISGFSAGNTRKLLFWALL